MSKEGIAPPTDCNSSAPPCWEPHNHKCECGTVWHHDPIDLIPLGYEAGSAAHDKSHHCPNCGKRMGWTDGSGLPATLHHNGIITEPLTRQPERKKDTLEQRDARRRLQMSCLIGSLVGK